MQCNEALSEDKIALLQEKGIKEIDLLFIDGVNVSACLRNTLLADKTATVKDAVLEIYRRLRPSNRPNEEVATTFFENLFFNAEYYDLSPVGRLKLDLKLRTPEDRLPLTQTTLVREDILLAVKELITQKDKEGPVDDIDHLGNRRVRAVGELLENQYRMGLVRMERAIKERMAIQDLDTLMPHDLINAKPVQAVIKEFFGTSQLSQFMDQTNPLSEITHKRRLSALGPGGLTRERAGFEVRDVHPTHYGRICPIETPEGPNIGLIVSLSTFARVNEFGFHRDPLPGGGEEAGGQQNRDPGHPGGPLPERPGRRGPGHRPGQRPPGCEGPLQDPDDRIPEGRRVHHRPSRPGGEYGRLAQPVGVGGRRL